MKLFFIISSLLSVQVCFSDDFDLANGRYYWLSENYCNFYSKDTADKKLFAGQSSSIFQVLYQKGRFAFIKFKKVSTSNSLDQNAVKIGAWPGDDICNIPIVNTVDTFAVELKKFSLLYHHQIDDDNYFDYILKGKIQDNTTASKQQFILIIDEGYTSKDSVMLFTDKNGNYELPEFTRFGFICLTGIKNKKAYRQQHEYITFTIIIHNRSFTKKMKQTDLDRKRPVIFDIII